MAKITVDGIDKDSAPSPMQRKVWQEDWAPSLPALTPWVTQDNLSYSCTTTANQAATLAVVEAELTRWQNEDLGHRGYQVSA